jgi:dolichol-phosphate mannosyltransferase
VLEKEKVKTNPPSAVILPTYCEAENIENLIRELLNTIPNTTIIVIDDSSPDGTAEIVRKLQKQYKNIMLHVRHAKLGLGTAITTGFHLAFSLPHHPQYVITMDADYSHLPKDIPKLLNEAKNGNDLVIGSRYVRGGKIVGWSPIRRIVSRIANIIAFTVTKKHIQDFTSGFRCYSIACLNSVLPYLHSQTYEIQIETIKQAKNRGLLIREVPITFTNRKYGKSKLTKMEIRSFLFYVEKSLIKSIRKN